MPLLYHAYVYLEFLILACTIYILAPPRILNSKKVSDHHAIIPTAEAIKTAPAALPENERNILFLIAAKLLMAVAQPFEYETVTASFFCGGMTFAAKGKTVKKEGYKELERRFRSTLKEQTKMYPRDWTD